ncbi:retroelement silencing factor 1 [Bufo bufo]|uniref:retroelement silencing factor 1 n=1 Tax=Bufo bufo TaxID=8384 RepID=UPI001ABDB4C5|nr:retroelement silencing factor 1 [Bufo bufo]
MDWSRRNSSGAVAHPNNQQYLPQSTSSTVPTISSQMAYVPPNAYNPAETFVTKSCNSLLLKGLLGANSTEEILKIQQSALLKRPVQQTMQVSPGQYNSSCNALHKTTTATNHQSNLNVQNPVVSIFPTQFYPNYLLQTVQQAQPTPVVQQQAQPAPMVQQQTHPAPVVQQQVHPVQCYGANGHNSREVQQSLQSLQSGGYSQKRAYQQMSNSYAAEKQSQNVQMGYRTIMPKQNSVAMHSVSPGSSAQNAGSYKGLNDKNVPVSSANYQYGQNIQNQIGSNSQTLSLTNTLQPKQDMNGPSPQKQMMPNLHSGFPNNPPSNSLPSCTVGQTPSLYSQSNTNVNNVTVNQQFSNANQNFVAQNVQQLAQSYTVPQEQHSVGAQPPPYSGHVPQDQRLNVPDILALLHVYQNVKQKYLLLNRENNLLRQKMQSSSQNNSGSCTVRPPLISSLSNSTDPTNDFIGQQVSQNSTLQSHPPSNTTHGVQNPSLHDASVNIPVQDISQPSNSFSNRAYPTNNSDVVGNQKNYTRQINVQNSANSHGQAIGSETLRVQDPKENTMVSIQSNNQYLSCANSSNGNLSQSRLHITSIQNLGQMTPASSESYLNHTTNVDNFYANKPLSSSSREAIKASLPLWKSVPQSSAPTKSDSESRQHINSLNSVNLLQEIATSPVNEPPVTLAQKPEHVSKGNERQVGVVPPLVQIKELVNQFNQLPKIVPQDEVLTSNRVNGFKENDCFRKVHLPFESVDATAIMNNLNDVRARSNMISSSPSKADQNSTENMETVDENLQISGICTLVKGNSLYDSSIAMMFEGSLQMRPDSQLAINDPKDDFTLKCSQEVFNISGASQATDCVSPTTETEAIKSETPCHFKSPANIEDNQQAANDCLGLQSEPNLSVSDVFDLESNTVSDQLSELLTEFPFGIKNYMSENEHDSIAISLPKLKEKLEIPQTSISFSYGSKSDGSIEDTQTECAVDTFTKEIVSESTEVIEQQSIDMSVPTPELPSDEETSLQLEDDCFEISDSPDSNIHITLLDQAEIPKLFPIDSDKPIQHGEDSGEGSSDEHYVKESKALVVDVAVSSIKEKSEEETTSVPDKELFCCLFSWLTHTNGNAPKCNCKFTELEEMQDLANKFSKHTAVVKNEPLTDGLDTSTDGLKPSSPCPFKMQPNEIKNDEILPQVSKYPKLEPIKISLESKHGPCIIRSRSKEEIQSKLGLCKTNLEDQSRKELIKNDTLTSENILQAKDQLEDPNTKGAQDPLSGCKSKMDPWKSEKLIVRTDFLKNKHLLKMKRKYKEMKTARVEEGVARNVHKINKNTKVGDSVKALNMARIIGDEANNEKCKLPARIVQPSVSSNNKLKSSSSSDKSHSHNKAPSLGKCKVRVKNRSESHYEKVKKVPTVQEYLERKRELCNNRPEPKVDKRDESPKVRHRVVERNENGSLATLIPPAKIDVKTKNIESEAHYQAQKGQPKTSRVYKSLHKKHRDPAGSHGKKSLINRGLDQKTTSSREKIYLSPLDGSRLASYEGISLTKLQIRHSPEKKEYFDRRKSLDSSVHSKQSQSDQSRAKNRETPKMLEFKLCPEFGNRSPSTQEKKGELKATKEKSVVEGIKSKKEAWCSSVPFKKRRMDTSFEDQGCQSPSLLSAFKSAQKNLKPVQDSQTTFNVFRQMYHEKRSKSLDSSL